MGVKGGRKQWREKEKQQHPRCTSLKFWKRGIKSEKNENKINQVVFVFVFFPIVYLYVVKMSSLFPKYMGIFAAITWSSSLFHDSGAE